MFTVALVGPDGSGKTTVARRLEEELEPSVRYLYMGVSADSSNRLLPTTRLVRAIRRARGAPPDTRGPRDPSELQRSTAAPRKRAVRSMRSGLRLANRLAEEWYRQLLAWSWMRRGVIVLFDRHYFADYHAYDVAGDTDLSLGRRVHGFLLAHAYPKPDLVIYLDAPPEVLLARKGEGTLELLARRRDDYLRLGGLSERFAIVDATQPIDEVVRRAVGLIREVDTERSGSRR